MSYTMHSPSQGYTNASADVYASRAYGSHLMAQNYTAYLNRDDPYSGSPAGHYPNGPGLQSAHYGASGTPMPQQTYPTLPPISHFPHQQDVYSSCVAPSPRNHSYPSTTVPVSSSLATSLPRHALSSKTYWDSLQNCYPASNSSINSALKTPPQAWSHSPNVLSSPSSTPSPIPCPSTPHHFASSPHHSQSHADGHKAYNGIISNTSLPNSNNGNAGANLNCSNNNPLQSLQKMVQIESENNDIRVQYETSASVAIGTVGQHSGGQSNSQVVPLESDPNYPTYYNLDQNRMCATPQSGYSTIPAQTINSAPFSPTMKNQAQQEIRPQSHQSNCSKQENGSENGDLVAVGGRTSSVRYPGKLSKENSFLNNRSCSTDTVCSNGSPSAQSAGKASSIAEPVIQAEQTHDSVNSFRGSETANSRDSVKSTDSDAMSSYTASQCPTPNNNNNNSNWKLNTAAATQASDFRPANFPINVQSKSWWPESAISPSASRSFTPHLPDCSAQYGSPTVSYPSPQVTHGSLPQTNSNGSITPGQPWSQQPATPPSVSTTPQMLPGAAFSADGVVVKKKRGRPFGSKNRRNLENPQNAEASKRKRKSVLVDIGVNTTLTFDVQASLNLDDSLAFAESSVKHTLPLVMKRKKFVGPVVRIDKTNGLSAHTKYSVVNKPDTASKSAEEDAKQKVSHSKATLDLLCPSRKNGLSKKCSNLLSSNANSSLHDKNWNCVLCHKGPHYKGLGDLYGPYYVLLDKGKLPCPLLDVESSAHDVAHDEVELPTELSHLTERRSLRRRVDSNNSEEAKKQSNVSANNEDNGAKESSRVSLEVWIHEDCIVWSNNVYLDGTTIRNLEPAIVESFGSICTKCKLPGATLGCIYKNCNVSPLHYLCAKDKDCDLDEEKFILSCSKHKKRRIAPKEQEVVEVSEATTTATIET